MTSVKMRLWVNGIEIDSIGGTGKFDLGEPKEVEDLIDKGYDAMQLEINTLYEANSGYCWITDEVDVEDYYRGWYYDRNGREIDWFWYHSNGIYLKAGKDYYRSISKKIASDINSKKEAEEAIKKILNKDTINIQPGFIYQTEVGKLLWASDSGYDRRDSTISCKCLANSEDSLMHHLWYKSGGSTLVLYTKPEECIVKQVSTKALTEEEAISFIKSHMIKEAGNLLDEAAVFSSLFIHPKSFNLIDMEKIVKQVLPTLKGGSSRRRQKLLLLCK